ncbi:MAG: DoxX family membrane protein [Micropruina sp.]|nr:MAG: DoxX family membrane protein [Micropruina sp.]
MSAAATTAPRRAPWQGWVTLGARIILGVVLLIAGGLKIGNLEASVLAVRAYQLVPFELTRPLGYALPIVEIAVGLMLIAGVFTRVAALAGAGLMLAFIIGIASVWARGISIDCGCFGGGGAVEASLTQYPLEIARDVGLLACGLWAAWRPTAPWSIDTWLFAAPQPIPDHELETEDVR